MKNGVPILGKVLFKRDLEVLVDVFALHKQKGQAVNKADYVRPPAVQVTPDPKLAYAKKIIVQGIGKVD